MLHTCPVRELDPEADFYINWMVATHDLTEQGWSMAHLPASGGMGAQDARLMQGIAIARAEANAFLREQRAERERLRQSGEFF